MKQKGFKEMQLSVLSRRGSEFMFTQKTLGTVPDYQNILAY
jgi:hypothetical protein